jgi:hypothetical protein
MQCEAYTAVNSSHGEVKAVEPEGHRQNRLTEIDSLVKAVTAAMTRKYGHVWTSKDAKLRRSPFPYLNLVTSNLAGSGFSEKELKEAIERMKPLFTAKSPFVNPPKIKEKIQWLQPKLVCESLWVACAARFRRSDCLRSQLPPGLGSPSDAATPIVRYPLPTRGDDRSGIALTYFGCARLSLSHPR